MQHYTEEELQWVEEYMNTHFKNDIPQGYITHLHQHSDNAATHFKSTGAIEYFTSLIKKLGRDATKCHYVYSFGAPGHGKGEFDGLGGTFKNVIHGLIRATKTSQRGIPGVESGYIQNVEDVYNALMTRFAEGGTEEETIEEGEATTTNEGTEEGIQEEAAIEEGSIEEGEEAIINDGTIAEGILPRTRTKAKNPINKYHFFHHDTIARPIHRPEEKFIKLDGISKNYQFVATGAGLVHMRQRSCWCMNCMCMMMEGSLNWPESKTISGCTSSTLSATVYQFVKKSCVKTLGTGVTTTRADRVHEKNEMTTLLRPGDWMFFKGGEGDSQLVWLGRAVSKTEWSNQCIWKNETGRDLIAGHVRVARNEYAINVQWYTLKQADNPLEYVIEKAEPDPIVNNNKELLHAGFPMTQVIGSRSRVPRRRNVRSIQSDDYEYDTPASLQTSEGHWFRKEWGNVWTIAQEDKDIALAKVGLV
eukprot:scaffold13403_cov120-Skeletonema_dohrnii-CCMP3373.AAC.2